MSDKEGFIWVLMVRETPEGKRPGLTQMQLSSGASGDSTLRKGACEGMAHACLEESDRTNLSAVHRGFTWRTH